MINYYYVIYKLTFENGTFYIGKAKDFNKRMVQHKNNSFGRKNLKECTICSSKKFTASVLYVAPKEFNDKDKEIWMNNMERIIIHREAKRVYDEITGEDSSYVDYQPYRKIINKKMVNTQLY